MIESTIKSGRSLILSGCGGIGKSEFAREEAMRLAGVLKLRYVDASSWRSEDFFKGKPGERAKRGEAIFFVPEIFRLKEAFSIINLLFGEGALFIATSSEGLRRDDAEYTLISGRFASFEMGSLDYRDWAERHPDRPYSDFLLNDYPGEMSEQAILGIISRGLKGGKRIPSQSQKILSFMKLLLEHPGEPCSWRCLSEQSGLSVHTVSDYLGKLISMGLLRVVRRVNLDKGNEAGASMLLYPTYNSFYCLAPLDLKEEGSLRAAYMGKLLEKLFSNSYQVCSGFLYSRNKGVKDRYKECGLLLSKGDERIHMLVDLAYDEGKAAALLSLRDGCPKYYVVLSEQERQTLNNGIRLIGIDRLIKGDLGEL